MSALIRGADGHVEVAVWTEGDKVKLRVADKDADRFVLTLGVNATDDLIDGLKRARKAAR